AGDGLGDGAAPAPGADDVPVRGAGGVFAPPPLLPPFVPAAPPGTAAPVAGSTTADAPSGASVDVPSGTAAASIGLPYWSTNSAWCTGTGAGGASAVAGCTGRHGRSWAARLAIPAKKADAVSPPATTRARGAACARRRGVLADVDFVTDGTGAAPRSVEVRDLPAPLAARRAARRSSRAARSGSGVVDVIDRCSVVAVPRAVRPVPTLATAGRGRRRARRGRGRRVVLVPRLCRGRRVRRGGWLRCRGRRRSVVTGRRLRRGRAHRRLGRVRSRRGWRRGAHLARGGTIGGHRRAAPLPLRPGGRR